MIRESSFHVTIMMASYMAMMTSFTVTTSLTAFNTTWVHYDVSSSSTNQTMWEKYTFPDPRRDVDLCGQNGRKSQVCDPNGLLEPDTGKFLALVH